MGDYGGRGYGGRGRGGGFKRRREEEQPLDPIRVLLANLMRVGDDAMPVSYLFLDACFHFPFSLLPCIHHSP